MTSPIFCCLFLLAVSIFKLNYPYLIKLTQIKSSQRWFQCICYQSNYQIVTGSVVVHSPINILVNTLVGAQLRKKKQKTKKTLLVRYISLFYFCYICLQENPLRFELPEKSWIRHWFGTAIVEMFSYFQKKVAIIRKYRWNLLQLSFKPCKSLIFFSFCDFEESFHYFFSYYPKILNW